MLVCASCNSVPYLYVIQKQKYKEREGVGFYGHHKDITWQTDWAPECVVHMYYYYY